MRMLANVQQRTSKALLKGTMAPGTGVYTDASTIDSRLEPWGDGQESVCQSRGA